MALLWSSNDSADFSNIATGGSYDATRVDYALVISDGTTKEQTTDHPTSSTDVTWYHFQVYKSGTSGTGEDGYLWGLLDTNGEALVRLNVQDGDWAAIAYGGASTVTSAYVTPPGATTVPIDFKVTVNSSNVIFELWISKALVATATADNSSGTVRTKPSKIILEAQDAHSTAATTSISEIIVSETTTVDNRLYKMEPTADGSDTQFTGDYTDVSDEDDLTFVYTDVSSRRSSFTIGTYSGSSSIVAIMLAARGVKGGSSPAGLIQGVDVGGTNYDSSSHSLTENIVNYTDIWVNDPDTSSPWLTTAITGLEISVKSSAT